MQPLNPALTLTHAAMAIARRTDVETTAFMMISGKCRSL
jgi:hypothetical protein